MQNDTGCKINVTPAAGADIQREIGLIGPPAAIEEAKRVIWNKVDTVVRVSKTKTILFLAVTYMYVRETRMLQLVGETMEAPIISPTMMHMRKERNHMPSQGSVSLIIRNLPQVLKLAMLILMPPGADIRTMLQCGMRHLPNSSSNNSRNKGSSKLKFSLLRVIRLLQTMRLPDYRPDEIRVT